MIREESEREHLYRPSACCGGHHGFQKGVENPPKLRLGISTYLSSSGIPVWMIAILIPLSIGIITGTTIGPMGIGFPILIPLFQQDPNFLNYMMLAFASGVAGDLLVSFI